MTHQNGSMKIPAAVPGKRTVYNLLATAFQPVGTTVYVWGGGWNAEDTGGGSESVTLGVSPRWKSFYEAQDASYDFEKTRYQIHDGLDCSGFVGWVIYNVLCREDGGESFVTSSTGMARSLAGKGLGTLADLREKAPCDAVLCLAPGDIMSMKGHVWIVLGTCADRSCVILHSSPAGVSLCGTASAAGGKSEAVCLAETYLREFFPGWYAKFPSCTREETYVQAERLRWNRETLADPEGIAVMCACEVLSRLFRTDNA